MKIILENNVLFALHEANYVQTNFEFMFNFGKNLFI